MLLFFLTFGCKVNQCETDAIRGCFLAAGHKVATDARVADIILVNSCTVTAQSDGKVQLALRRLRKQNPEAYLVLTGCYPQAHADAAAHCPEADLITGTKHRAQLVTQILEGYADRKRTSCIEPYAAQDVYESMPCTPSESKTRAFLKIQDGCNQFCSYCIIPYARGRNRSMPLTEVRQQAEQLAAQGYAELVLVGINLAFYGAAEGLRLADAVEACAAVPTLRRIRLGSLEPERITSDDLARFAACGKFCPQFHLSLQSGCDRVLRAMNRRYTTAEYKALVESIRQVFPDAAITTDIMVGFPGETEAEFEDSLAFVREIGFAHVHVFPYSPREGTRAAAMPDQISQAVKHARAAAMTACAAEARAAFLRGQVGRTVPVLFERSPDPAFQQGHAPNGTLIKIPAKKGEKSLRKSVFHVIIEDSQSDSCTGRLAVPPVQAG